MQPSCATRRSRLLVVHADTRSKDRICRALDSAGYDVQVADDGEAGLELTRGFRPDVVICDRAAGRVDGLDFCRRVKRDSELRGTYVVVLFEAETEAEDRVPALDAGADAFVTQPLSDFELLAHVRVGLRFQQMRQEMVQAERRVALHHLSAAIGDEINNPLTGLFGHLELLLHHLEAGNRSRMLHHIRKSGELAGRIADVAQRLTAMDRYDESTDVRLPAAPDLGRPDPSGQQPTRTSPARVNR